VSHDLVQPLRLGGRLDRRVHRIRVLQSAGVMGPTMIDNTKILAVVTESLSTVNSVRDFLIAVQVGSKVADEMLEAAERDLLDALVGLNKDAAP
jgi:hypothetical protein